MAKQRSDLDLREKVLQTVRKRSPETVKQLVEIVRSENHSVSEKAVMEQVVELESQGRINFRKQEDQVTQSIFMYVRSPKSYWYWTTLFLTLVTGAAAFAISQDAYPLIYVRYLLGWLFVLWLPGYSFIRALFPVELPFRSSSKELELLARAVLSIGINLALVPLIGLILNYTPWGLQFVPIVGSLIAFTTVSATVAVAREYYAQLNKDPQKMK